MSGDWVEHYKIMVVDDEPDLLEIYEFSLKKRGFQVVTADCGNNAIQKLISGEKVDLILTDFRMPNGNGLDVLRSVRDLVNSNQLASIPVIVITGWIEPGVVDAMKEGAVSVHSKPISFDSVLQDIQNILNLNKFDSNRRLHPRKDISLNTKISKNGSSESSEMIAKNISLGGILIVNNDQPLIVNETYQLKLGVDNKQKKDFVAYAICRWQRNSNHNSTDTHKTFQIGFAFNEETKERMILDDILNVIEVINS